MKIIKETSEELILTQSSGGNIFSFIFGLFFSGIPLVMLFGMLYDISFQTIECQRIEPMHINCDIHTRQFVGLIPQATIKLPQVTQVEYQRQETKDSEGDRLIENAVIFTYDHRNTFRLQLDLMYFNGVKGDAQKMQNLTSELTQFLTNTAATSWHFTLNNWHSGRLIAILFLIPFIAIGGGMMIYAVLSAGIGKFSFNKIRKYFRYQNTSRLKKEDTLLPLTAIDKLLIEQTKDSDGDITLTLFLLLKQKPRYEMMASLDIEKTETLANTIKDFLQCELERRVIE